MNLTIRQAVHTDIPVLRKLIEVSVRGLQTRDYSPSQIESALVTVYGVDSQLITDGTYFVVEATSPEENLPKAKLAKAELVIVGCGGWSRRKTLFGADQWTDREDSLLSPQRDAAKIRAFFVHRLGTAGHRQHDSRGLRKCCGRCRFYAPRNGGHAQWTAILSGSRIHRFGGARCSLSKRRIAPHHSHGEARLSYCSEKSYTFGLPTQPLPAHRHHKRGKKRRQGNTSPPSQGTPGALHRQST
jgi:hypothetical protein